ALLERGRAGVFFDVRRQLVEYVAEGQLVGVVIVGIGFHAVQEGFRQGEMRAGKLGGQGTAQGVDLCRVLHEQHSSDGEHTAAQRLFQSVIVFRQHDDLPEIGDNVV